MLIFIFTLVVILTYFIVQRNKNYQSQTDQQEQLPIEPIQETSKDYSASYQKRFLLTKNEWHEYKKLKAEAAMLGLQVCPKVRLLDLLEPRKGPDYMSCLGRVQSKHVDFVLCDESLYIKAIVEIDDNSHNRKDRQERDEFVDQVLQSVGYTVIHTRAVTETTLDVLKPKIEETNEGNDNS